MKKNYLGFSVYLTIASFLGFFASSVVSQETGKQIRLIVPFAPGGSNDIVGRAVAQQLSPRLKRSVIVENKPGAGGVLGAEIAARAEPDGNTLLLISSSFAMNSSIMKLSYDPVKSFAPLAMLGMGPSVIVVNSATPVNSIKELVDFSNNNPSKTNFGTAGVGSFQHFAIELFKLKTGANFVLVHYKGGGPALVDLAAGHIQISLGSLIQMQNFMKAGQIKVLAVAGSKRVPLLPNVPTLKELGIDVEASNWWAILAPTGTSNELLDTFHKEINQVLVDPEIKRRFANEGAESLPMSRLEFEKLLSEESVKWARVAKLTGIKAE